MVDILKSEIKLIEWQRIDKDLNDIIVQNSPTDGSSSWQNIYIGMSWQYCTLSDETKKNIQIGNHDKLLLCSMSSNTDSRRRGSYKINREKIMNNLRKNGFTNLRLNAENYFNSLKNYKFIISPKGNGIDCHRHYEALLSGCIPICEYNKKTKEKYKNLPILYTTDYSEITNDYLESKYQEMLNKDYNFEKLFVSYYNTKIQSKIYKQSEYWCNKLVGKSYYTSI